MSAEPIKVQLTIRDFVQTKDGVAPSWAGRIIDIQESSQLARVYCTDNQCRDIPVCDLVKLWRRPVTNG